MIDRYFITIVAVTVISVVGTTYTMNLRAVPETSRVFSSFDERLDDLNRRTCEIYRQRVAERRMRPGEPAFADCK